MPLIQRRLLQLANSQSTPALSKAMGSTPLALMPSLPPNTSYFNRSPLTLEQLLKSPLVPPPPKELSANGSAADDAEPTPHTSSKNNRYYGGMDDQGLKMFTRKKVRTFCDYVTALSGFLTFPNDMKQPFSASTISNEGDVSAYLESQVIIPTWEAVTRMFPPSQRTYDLMSKRQFYMQGIPDLVFGTKILADDGSGRHVYTPRAILELKRSGIVEGLLPVFVNRVYRNNQIDLPSDWVTVTQQLRKYAISASCNHILVMDQRVGIYFEFDDPSDDDEYINYLLSVPSDLLNDENRLIAPHGFTLRELLAFMCYRAFGSVFELRTAPAPDSDMISGSSETYSASLPPDVGSGIRNHSVPDNQPSRQQPNRTAKSSRAQPPDDTPTPFTAWVPGSAITLRICTDDTPGPSPSSNRPRAVSKSDSGFHETLSPRRRNGAISTRPFNPPQPPAGTDTLTYTVSHIFTRAAALLETPAGVSYVAKLFSPLHTGFAHELLAGEMAVYSAALTLEGREIPYFYGRWSIPGATHVGVLLTEYIQPGLTIAQLKVAGAFGKISKLRESAEMAVKALHGRGVRHGDLVGRNMVVSGEGEEERVVIVDFDVAQIEGREGERRRWADWVFLKDTFRVPE